jgi:alanine dehydrogenase
MNIGVPKEIKVKEERVGLFPGGVRTLVKAGHTVVIEKGAGSGCGLPDEQYEAAGAVIGSRDEAWSQELVVKVKEPQSEEYRFLGSGLTLFTYLHLAANEELTRILADSGCVAIAYESVETADGALPLLGPMSEIAGRMSVIKASNILSNYLGGSGKLVCGVTGVKPCSVVIIGAGISGANAAEIAFGLGADVTVLDINIKKLDDLYFKLNRQIKTVFSTPESVYNEVVNADIVISCVLIPNAAAPKLITKKMLDAMHPGSVVVDIAIDQGGSTELSEPTTHKEPCITVGNGVNLYCVANMPGCYPRTSAEALTNSTLKYVQNIADNGWKEAVVADPSLRKGLNVVEGKVVCKPVADIWEMPYEEYNG